MARKNKIDTKLEIVAVATRLFLEKGYTNVMIADIAKEIGISKGNLAFHFRTKEHLLAELIKILCDFQWQMMEREVITGHSSLIAYLFEITAAACICHEDVVARDLYVSAYTSPLSLQLIRESDVKKARNIFAASCPDWQDTDFLLAENLASGIEYSMFTASADIPLDRLLSRSLHTILCLYQIPEDVRTETIRIVLEMDYANMGRQMLRELEQYVEAANQAALKEAAERKAAKARAKKTPLANLDKLDRIKHQEKRTRQKR